MTENILGEIISIVGHAVVELIVVVIKREVH